ncbi:hypothetical protein BJ741DRAFT_678882 [Chytriomyces cf. hyalinus JEL632]|nr:hypothetical protein BJ741DRAFT_678882 [Chytriomyces cf. hyalinus JEL632]
MSGKPKSPKSRLKAQMDKNNQAAKKVADQKAKLALREQRNRVQEEARVRKLEIKQQKAAAKEKELALKRRLTTLDRTEDERYELLAAFKECTELYMDVDEKAVGFVPRAGFRKEFFDNEVNRARHNLESWDGDQCLRQIDSLTELYKKIYDTCQQTGGGGLNDTLQKFQIPHLMYTAIGDIYEFHHRVKVTSLVESGFHSHSDKDSELDSEKDEDTASENNGELPEGDKDCDNKDFDEFDNSNVFNSPGCADDFLDPIDEGEANEQQAALPNCAILPNSSIFPSVEAASKAAPAFREWSFVDAAKIQRSTTSASVTTSMDTAKSPGGPTGASSTRSHSSAPLSAKSPSSVSGTKRERPPAKELSRYHQKKLRDEQQRNDLRASLSGNESSGIDAYMAFSMQQQLQQQQLHQQQQHQQREQKMQQQQQQMQQQQQQPTFWSTLAPALIPVITPMLAAIANRIIADMTPAPPQPPPPPPPGERENCGNYTAHSFDSFQGPPSISVYNNSHRQPGFYDVHRLPVTRATSSHVPTSMRQYLAEPLEPQQLYPSHPATSSVFESKESQHEFTTSSLREYDTDKATVKREINGYEGGVSRDFGHGGSSVGGSGHGGSSVGGSEKR